MKITKNITKKYVFKNIRVGEWFIDADGDIMIKLNDSDTDDNCIYFKEDGAHFFGMDEENYVYPIEVELIATDKQ